MYYTASGIITPVGGRSVHGTATYRCDKRRFCALIRLIPKFKLTRTVSKTPKMHFSYFSSFISLLH